MKKITSLLMLLSCAAAVAQVSSEPKEIDPNAPVKIIVNLQQLDQSKDYVQNLLDSASNGADLYIWTFSPAEHGAAHPLTNGKGATPWKNSNDTLRMTKEEDDIYSYTLTPTEFYEVDAATVYAKDIKFLVKTKDGGGYGDPDVKSDDLTLAVDPPSLVLDPAHTFPTEAHGNDLVGIYYENDRETKVSMQNLGPDECFVYAKAWLSDSTEVQIQPFTSTSSNPQLQMDYVGDQTFRKFIIPNVFFNVDVASGVQVERMRFIVVRKSPFTTAAQRVDKEINIDLRCD